MHSKFLKTSLLLAMAASSVSCGKTVESLDVDDSNLVAASDTSYDTDVYQEDYPETVEIENESPTETPTQSPEEFLEMPEYAYIPDSYMIYVDTIYQNPELPTGCEATALTTVLNYLGFYIDKVELCDEFLPIEYPGEATFDEAFIGNPKSSDGYGCNAPVIVQTADSYFDSVGADWSAYDLTGTDFCDLFYQVSNDRPVIVWASMSLMDVQMTYRWTTDDGDEAWFAELEHCMVLKGYDEINDLVYVCDPLKGDMEYSLSRFETIYETLGKQAVVLYNEAELDPNYTGSDESYSTYNTEEEYLENDDYDYDDEEPPYEEYERPYEDYDMNEEYGEYYSG